MGRASSRRTFGSCRGRTASRHCGAKGRVVVTRRAWLPSLRRSRWKRAPPLTRARSSRIWSTSTKTSRSSVHITGTSRSEGGGRTHGCTGRGGAPACAASSSLRWPFRSYHPASRMSQKKPAGRPAGCRVSEAQSRQMSWTLSASLARHGVSPRSSSQLREMSSISSAVGNAMTKRPGRCLL